MSDDKEAPETKPVSGNPPLPLKEEEDEDFGTRWNKRMDELGARRGTIEDLKSI